MKCIWLKKPTQRLNLTLGFRYTFKMAYERLALKIAAVSTFRVFLNGKFVLAGPVRSGRGRSIISKLQVSVKQGDVLCVEVCNYRINAFYPLKEDGFFACEGETNDGAVVLGSDDFTAFLLSDRIEKTQRYNFQRSFTEAYRMDNCRTSYRLGKNTFFTVETVEVKGNLLIETDAPVCLWTELFAEGEIERGDVYYDLDKNPMKEWIFDKIDDTAEGYPLKDTEIKISEEVLKMGFNATKKTGALCDNEYVLYKFPRNITGLIGLDIVVEEDSEIYLLFDEIIWTEALERDDCAPVKKWTALPLVFCRTNSCNAIYYHLKKGAYRLLASEPYTLQYLKIVCKTGRVNIKALPRVVLWQNDGVYKCNYFIKDERLQKIFKAAQHTLAQNTPDVPTDCPGRERAGWLCDSFFTSRAEFAVCGNNKCEENFFNALLSEENYEFLPKGVFPMCYPADHNDGLFIPNWTMWLVLEVYDHFKRTGNKRFLEAFKERFYRLKRYFDGFINEEGLLENVDGWTFVEWSKCNSFIDGVNFPTNMLYAKMLSTMGEVYGDEILLKESENIVKKIRELSYDGVIFRDHMIRVNGQLQVCEDATETCQYYAFFLGVATKEKDVDLFRFMFEKIEPFGKEEIIGGKPLYKANTFIGVVLRFSYLFEQGYTQKILKELTDFFYPMAIRTDTLWELKGTKSSLNHGFTSIVAAWILQAEK